MKLQNNLFMASLLVLVIWMIITMYGEVLQAGSDISLTELVSQQIIYALLLAPLFLLAVIVFFRWENIGINFPKTVRSLLVLWFPVLYIVVMLGVSSIKGFPDAQIVVFILVNSLLVGVSEELMFRGVLFKAAVSRFSMWQAIWLVSIVFGGIHAFNSFITGEISAAFIQAFMATMSGIWFMAIRIRTDSLIPVMIVHGLWDFSIFTLTFGSTVDAADKSYTFIKLFAPILFILPLFLYGLFLLRGVANKKYEICSN